jgi:phosphohistidine phosphatase
MQLFIIRHAVAVPRSKERKDASRPLTERGRRQWRRAVRGLERLGLRFDRVYHSSWRRAVETAEALSNLIDGESVATDRLAQSPTPALLRELVGARVALVGHQPWLGELIELLVAGGSGGGTWLELDKGGLAWLEGEPRPHRMVLRALLPPKVLRAVR